MISLLFFARKLDNFYIRYLYRFPASPKHSQSLPTPPPIRPSLHLPICPPKTSVETALLAQQLGTRAIIIIEKLHEIDLVLAASKKLDIKPIVGVRARLSQRGSGRWGDSTGDRAKFGLSCADMIEVWCVCARRRG